MPFFLSSSCSAGGGVSDERVSPSRCEGEGGFVGVQKRAARKGSSVLSWRAGLTVLASAVTGVALYRLAQDVFVSKAMAGRIEFVHRRVAALLYR